jgi:tetratricopeptide (TPR) repeat protein
MTVDESPATERPDRAPRDERWYLTDEREFLQRSLDDADREREAGDLSDEDHAVLVGRDRARLAEVDGELAALDAARLPSEDVSSHSLLSSRAPAAQPERTSMPLWRKLGILGSCLLIAVGCVILVVHFVQSRQPGQASSGSVTVSQAQLIEQQLAQADALNQEGSNKTALVLYDKVLTEDPSNPHALAYAGFLQWNIGSTARVPSLTRVGRSEIQTAIKSNPSYGQAHLFYGLVLENQDHNHAGAVAQFNDFLTEAPPASELSHVAGLVAGAYKEAGLPLPSQFSATTTTTISTP